MQAGGCGPRPGKRLPSWLGGVGFNSGRWNPGLLSLHLETLLTLERRKEMDGRQRKQMSPRHAPAPGTLYILPFLVSHNDLLGSIMLLL